MQIWGCLSVSVILLYIWSTSIKSDMCATFKSSNPNTNWCQHTWKGIWIKTDHICTSLKFSVSSFRKPPVCTNATITFDFYFSLGITNKWLKSYHTNVLNVYSFETVEMWSAKLCLSSSRAYSVPLFSSIWSLFHHFGCQTPCEHPAAPVNLLVMAPWGLNSPDPLKELVPSTYSPVTWTGSILGRVGVSPVLLDETQLQTISAPSLRDVYIFHKWKL